MLIVVLHHTDPSLVCHVHTRPPAYNKQVILQYLTTAVEIENCTFIGYYGEQLNYIIT